VGSRGDGQQVRGWHDFAENQRGGRLSDQVSGKVTTFQRIALNARFRAAGKTDPDDPLTWNSMRVSDIGRPRVFLCKSSLFLEKLNKKMGGDGIASKERFGPEEFEVKPWRNRLTRYRRWKSLAGIVRSPTPGSRLDGRSRHLGRRSVRVLSAGERGVSRSGFGRHRDHRRSRSGDDGSTAGTLRRRRLDGGIRR